MFVVVKKILLRLFIFYGYHLSKRLLRFKRGLWIEKEHFPTTIYGIYIRNTFEIRTPLDILVVSLLCEFYMLLKSLLHIRYSKFEYGLAFY